MGDNRKKTRGRLRPWSCGHKGWGVECHRCGQANQIEVRANELAQLLKTKGSKLPDYVQVTKENGTTVSLRGGGRVWTGELSGKKSLENVLADLVHQSREYATHLKNRPGEVTKKLVQQKAE